jgi:hypothetical protein
VASKRAGFWRRHRRLQWLAGALLLVLVALGVAVAVVMHRAEPMLREVIVERLHDHFHARVELASFHISLVNGLWAEGKGLEIWPPSEVVGVTVPGAPNASPPPLIRIAEFRFHAPLSYKPGKPIRISVVELKGLDIDVPPKPRFTHAASPAGSSGGSKSTGATLLRFAVSSIVCTGAHLTVETSKPGKLPLEFAIAHVKLTRMTAGGPMDFDAELTNPRPAGLILTSGNLGPWVVEDPGETPVSGRYRFEHADLGVFKGIAGILNSTGEYHGVLRDLVVDGQTDTPDFRLTHFGAPVPLTTRFHAQVDGTNGDTWLQPVDATLGQSHLTAVGQIVRQQAKTLKDGRILPAGHDIELRVNVDRGHIEDFLRLASHSGAPLLTGDLTLKTALEIPPGKETVLERLTLNGNFSLDDADFTSAKIQDWVGELSLRGQGDPKAAKSAGADVRSAMQSDFQMSGEKVTLPDLKYTVPGAEIDLKGTYGIDGSTLDFVGTARTEAKVSQMVGGWKGLLLKPADRLFEKDGAGTLVPIHISGTREDPKFGVDFKHVKHTSPEIPGASH